MKVDKLYRERKRGRGRDRVDAREREKEGRGRGRDRGEWGVHIGHIRTGTHTGPSQSRLTPKEG